MANKETIKLYNGDVTIDFYIDSHRYRNLETKEWIPSVTSITGLVDKSRPLLIWSENLSREWFKDNLIPAVLDPKLDIGEDELEQMIETGTKQYAIKRDEAATVGTLAHLWVEEYINSKLHGTPEPKKPKDERVYNSVIAFLKWLDEHKVKFHDSERYVYSKTHGYCGLVDCIATVDGKKHLIDFKTSKGVYPEFFLQVAGYWGAYLEETDDELDNCLILNFGKDDAEFKVYECPDPTSDFSAFIACLHLKNRLGELNKSLKK